MRLGAGSWGLTVRGPSAAATLVTLVYVCTPTQRSTLCPPSISPPSPPSQLPPRQVPPQVCDHHHADREQRRGGLPSGREKEGGRRGAPSVEWLWLWRQRRLWRRRRAGRRALVGAACCLGSAGRKRAAAAAAEQWQQQHSRAAEQRSSSSNAGWLARSVESASRTGGRAGCARRRARRCGVKENALAPAAHQVLSLVPQLASSPRSPAPGPPAGW